MIDKAWKIAMAIGLTAGVTAIVLSIFSGTHLHWKAGETGGNIDIRIGADNGLPSEVLGAIAIICLLFGSAFLAVSKKSETAAEGNMNQTNTSFLTFLQNLTKSEADCWLGGVCGGLGTHSPVPSWVWRMIFLVLALCFGTGAIAYIILWICLPKEKPRPVN